MKTLFGFGLLGCLAVSACAASQAPVVAPAASGGCQGPVTIARQADVSSVGRLCATIDGDLRIIGTSLTSLDGLDGVHSVHNVVIQNNPMLTNVAGLRGLRTVMRVTVKDNPSLTSLDGLDRLGEMSGVATRTSSSIREPTRTASGS